MQAARMESQGAVRMAREKGKDEKNCAGSGLDTLSPHPPDQETEAQDDWPRIPRQAKGWIHRYPEASGGSPKFSVVSPL